MDTYKCRMVVPKELPWKEFKAESEEAAAGAYHYDLPGNQGIFYIHDLGDDRSVSIYFALIEVEGFGTFVSRTFYSGIYRRGGVRRSTGPHYLKEVATKLGWTHDPQDLIRPGWDGEDEDLEF